MASVTLNIPDDPAPRELEVSTNESPKYRRKISRGPSLDSEAMANRMGLSPEKPFTPKGNLLKPTQSRLHEIEVTEARIKEVHAQKEEETLKRALSFKKIETPKSDSKKNNGPSDRLLKTTQARIIDTRELELRKDRILHEDDIWWDIRKSAELASKRPGVQSKLHEPTVAYLASNRNKHPLKKSAPNGPPESPEREHLSVQKIDSESPLLKPTRSSVIGMYGKDLSVLEDLPTFQPTLVTNTDSVQSKLMEPTQAAAASRYKTKEELAEEEAAALAATKANAPKVKDVSERLTTLNANMKHSQRTKAAKEADGDGWNYETQHVSIPEPEPVTLPTRRLSASNDKTPTKRTSLKGSTPTPAARAATEAVAPTEDTENGMDVSSGGGNPETD